MRISFICGSLVPGKDGVGDYTSRLASALQREGHDCQLIALNDLETVEPQTEDGVEIIRIQDADATSVRNSVDRWDPEWISLQFVCFAFHPKGFIHRLRPLVASLRQGRKLELMFHELWVGEQPSLPFKHKVMGRIQRWQILRALTQWEPDCLHTSNRLYQHILERHRHTAERLPIFGNIPIAPAPDAAEFQRAANERIVLFPFSQRHDWNVAETLARLKSMAGSARVSLILIQVGHLRSRGGGATLGCDRGLCPCAGLAMSAPRHPIRSHRLPVDAGRRPRHQLRTYRTGR